MVLVVVGVIELVTEEVPELLPVPLFDGVGLVVAVFEGVLLLVPLLVGVLLLVPLLIRS